MDTSKEQYKIVFTKDAKNEMDYIYHYIYQNLFAPNSAKKLMNKVEEVIQDLKYMPKTHKIIKKYPELKMEYRRIAINNYVIIYTVSEEEKIVYIVHMYYGGSNYLNKI